MLPLSLYETGESNGSISLMQLFKNSDSFCSCHSNINIDDIIFSICRGGWPAIFTLKSDEEKLFLAKDLYKQTYQKDISNIDKVKKEMQITLKQY